MSENLDPDSKERTPGRGTCPFCETRGSVPANMDSWWCPNCKREYPTGAFKCRHADCWEFVFLDDYCERHKPQAEQR